MVLVKNILCIILFSYSTWSVTAERSTIELYVTPEPEKVYKKGNYVEFHCCGRVPYGGSLQWYQVNDKNHTVIQSTSQQCESSWRGKKMTKRLSQQDHNTYLFCVYWNKEQTNPRTGYLSKSIELRLNNDSSTIAINHGIYVTIKPTSRQQIGTIVDYICELHKTDPGEEYHVDLYQENGNLLKAYETNEQHHYKKNISESDNNSKIYCVVSTKSNPSTLFTSTKIYLTVDNSNQAKNEYYNKSPDNHILYLVLPLIVIILIVAGLLILCWRRRCRLVETESEAVTYAELYIPPPATNKLCLKEDHSPYAKIIGFLKPKHDVCQSLRH